MNNWIDTDSDIEPPRNTLLITYCPEWCEERHQIAMWNGSVFYYEACPNDMFSGLVERWRVLHETD